MTGMMVEKAGRMGITDTGMIQDTGMTRDTGTIRGALSFMLLQFHRLPEVQIFRVSLKQLLKYICVVVGTEMTSTTEGTDTGTMILTTGTIAIAMIDTGTTGW